jgi:S-DNA-T family DNA segregation ATPase FtsK/SpoIIIE
LKNKKRQELLEKEVHDNVVDTILLEEKKEEDEVLTGLKLIKKSELLPFDDPFKTTEIKLQTPYKKIDSTLLKEIKVIDNHKLKGEIQNNSLKLDIIFKNFGIDAKVIDFIDGPSLTKYIIKPEPGINLKKFAQIENNIKMTLAAKNIRMELPIPGRDAIGIEVPNKHPKPVSFKEIFSQLDKKYPNSPLAAALGKKVDGTPLMIEINKTPHILIAGATGSGKSVGINALLISMIMRSSPRELQLVLIDPKMVEFSPYKGLPHLYAPIIIDPMKASKALSKIVEEMEKRYLDMSKSGVRSIEEYNQKFKNKK